MIKKQSIGMGFKNVTLNKILCIFILQAAAILFLFGWVFLKRSNDLIYIDNISLYKSFKLTGELEAKSQSIFSQRAHILDSLETNLETLIGQIKDNGNNELVSKNYENAKEELLLTRGRFNDDNAAIVQKFEDEIWTQLNQYVKDFGDEEKLDIIFGVAGKGNIMYAKEGIDRTEEVINYVNRRYQGFNK